MALNEKVSEFTKETTFHGLKYVFSGETKLFRRQVQIEIHSLHEIILNLTSS